MPETPVDRLRRLLPGAKRILSRQFTAEPWHALCAAEDLLRELDEAKARVQREATEQAHAQRQDDCFLKMAAPRFVPGSRPPGRPNA
ncbi:MAG TPA: hypothetical protein DCQ64_25415 [Candidatus Rokubacteria bacterium]|nr:hypothetical protein [Candidatus Rokubacteria bacterium]